MKQLYWIQAKRQLVPFFWGMVFVMLAVLVAANSVVGYLWAVAFVALCVLVLVGIAVGIYILRCKPMRRMLKMQGMEEDQLVRQLDQSVRAGIPQLFFWRFPVLLCRDWFIYAHKLAVRRENIQAIRYVGVRELKKSHGLGNRVFEWEMQCVNTPESSYTFYTPSQCPLHYFEAWLDGPGDSPWPYQNVPRI